MKEWLKSEWFKLALLGLFLAVIFAGWQEWQEFKTKPAIVPPPISLQVPPTVLPATHTTSIETRYIPQPAADPAKVRLEMKPADFVVAAGEQQVVVKGLPGETAPLQNGQLGFAVESRAKIDVTDMVRAQVNDKLAIQSAQLKAEADKKTASIRRQRTVGYVVGGLAVGALVYTAVKK